MLELQLKISGDFFLRHSVVIGSSWVNCTKTEMVFDGQTRAGLIHHVLAGSVHCGHLAERIE